jgi:FADH2 O2-dependent halogenase
MLLQQCGRRTLVIDRTRHPRFAIGESTTPIANMVLGDLARGYSLPQLSPLCKYGTWHAALPELRCGLKRGFSYFRHEPNLPFQPRADHANELLVAANADDQHSDTHWFRADVDHFLVREARRQQIEVMEEAVVRQLEDKGPKGWELCGEYAGEPLHVSARFVVDATGPAGVLPQRIPANDATDTLQTRSRATYAHFAGIVDWREFLETHGGDTSVHPFDCDDAAQHHIFDEGWLWVLRFDNGVTSVGWVADEQPAVLSGGWRSLGWDDMRKRYPSFDSLVAQASCVDPPGQLITSSRLQRLWRNFVGSNWAALPHTAGFIDPLNSTGIALALCGVERLIAILERDWHTDALFRELKEYERTVHAELRLIDRLMAGCFRTMRNFPLFVTYLMLYFAAATTYEHRRASSEKPHAFLCADDAQFVELVDTVYDCISSGGLAIDPPQFARFVAERIRPFNHVGLFAPEVPNMYRYTAAPPF